MIPLQRLLHIHESPQTQTSQTQTLQTLRGRPLLSDLVVANAGDLYRALGVDPESVWGWGLRPLVYDLARRFSERLRAFDEDVAARGLQTAAQGLLEHYTASALPISRGVGHLPATGALLVTANHPGLSDVLALLATLPRADVKIIAAARPLLTALPHVHGYLEVIDHQPSKLLRRAIRHLQTGGCVVLFPAGRIEADPARDMTQALSDLAHWSRSAELFAHAVPELQICTAVVRNVLHPEVCRHPLAGINAQDRAWLEATLQILLPRYHHLPVRIDYAPVPDACELTTITRSLMSCLLM